MEGGTARLVDLRLLSLEDWVFDIATEVLGLPPEVVARVANLEVVADALTLPATQLGGELIFKTSAEQVAALMGRLLRGRAIHYREREVAVATCKEFLARNGCTLAIPSGEAGRFHRLLGGISRNRAAQSALVRFLERYIVLLDRRQSCHGRESLLVYVALPERAVDGYELRGIYDRIDREAAEAASVHPERIDLVTTCPGLIPRQPEEAWEIRRRVLHGVSPGMLNGRPYWASGMIVVNVDGDAAVLGLELLLLGRRCPVLWLQPAEVPMPSVVAGYGLRGGSVYPRVFRDEEEMGEHVRAFVESKATVMLELARERRDAVLASTLRQVPLRDKLGELSPDQLLELLARTNLRATYADQLANEPAEFVRVERGDLHKFANELEIPASELAAVEPAPRLNRGQESALTLVVRQHHLSGEAALRLRRKGERLLATSNGSVQLGDPEDWERLLPRHSHA